MTSVNVSVCIICDCVYVAAMGLNNPRWLNFPYLRELLRDDSITVEV